METNGKPQKPGAPSPPKRVDSFQPETPRRREPRQAASGQLSRMRLVERLAPVCVNAREIVNHVDRLVTIDMAGS